MQQLSKQPAFELGQNAATLFPLRICSEISLRHFVHAFLFRFRCVIAQLCYATTILCKMRFTQRSRSSAIGIGGVVAHSPLPHHRMCGSAYGGSVGYAGPSNSRGRPSESK